MRKTRTRKYTFTDGTQITSRLDKSNLLQIMDRLSTLRVLTEGYESGEGLNIYNKANRAYNKYDDFTGIIRLNILEKDFLSYLLESEYLTKDDIETINYYIKGAC